MNLVELRLVAPAAGVDTLSDALLELDALSVTIEDADADTPDEAPIFGEPGMPAANTMQAWQHSVLKALFEHEAAATQAATLLLAQDWTTGVHVQALVPVDEQDWVRLTQSQFEPVRITDSFWIVPSWHQAPAEATQILRLDPGLAFGTGTHPTTRMCLRWIAGQAAASGQALSWPRVLDYGCGSGILAIAAGLCGARGIDAVDVDPAAITATLANAKDNGVPLSAGLPAAAQGQYPVVLANILAAPLKLLAPVLCHHLSPGGHLVLAGLLARQVEELQEAYAPWLPLQPHDAQDGWVLLHGVRGSAAAAPD